MLRRTQPWAVRQVRALAGPERHATKVGLWVVDPRHGVHAVCMRIVCWMQNDAHTRNACARDMCILVGAYILKICVYS